MCEVRREAIAGDRLKLLREEVEKLSKAVMERIGMSEPDLKTRPLRMRFTGTGGRCVDVGAWDRFVILRNGVKLYLPALLIQSGDCGLTSSVDELGARLIVPITNVEAVYP